MVVVSYALVTFLCIDALMIGKMLGMAELGFYTIALMSVQQIGSLGRFSQIILIPHIQERYGKTGRLEDASALFLRSTRILAYAMPWIISAVIFFVPMLVHLLLPKFIPGLPAMKILVIGYYFVAVNELTVNAAYTADKQRRIIPFMLVVIAAAAALNYAFIKSGWGIQGVALATSLSYFVYFAVTLPFSYAGQMRPGETLKLVAGITAVFAYFCAAVMIADRVVSIPSSIIVEAVLKFMLFALLFSPMLYRLEKEEKLAGAIGGILHKKWALR
jgi:O-antigen/teichoic acid export membrane protein